MTRGGTGDLVTGAVAGLLSRRVDPLHSAFLASYIIGVAGVTAFNRMGYSYLISDLLDIIPEILVTKVNKIINQLSNHKYGVGSGYYDYQADYTNYRRFHF